VALEILLRDGCRDLFLAVDPQNPPELRRCLAIQPEWGLRTDARACWVRLDAQGQVRGLAVWQGRRLCMASLRFELETRVGFAQASCAGSQARLVAGDGALKAARSAPASGGP